MLFSKNHHTGAWSLFVIGAAAGSIVACWAEAANKNIQMMPLVPHHVQKARRLKELQNQYRGLRIDPEVFEHQFRRREAQQVGALYHGYGTHYADVWVGSPPQRQTVIVDTGSSLTAFPCSGCNDCGAPNYHIDDYFIFEESSTFVKTDCGDCKRGTCSGPGSDDEMCKISMSYQEGSSWFAFEAKDISYVGGPHKTALLTDAGTESIDPRIAKQFAFEMTFGCQYRLTGLFKTQLADGIMGMENANTSFWKQMYAAGKMGDEQKFSLCFSRPPQASRDGTVAGAMTFGGAETRFHKTDMVYSSQASGRSGFFAVHLRNIYLREGMGGESAKSIAPGVKVINLDLSEEAMNRGGIIVDSGTTDSYFTIGISKAFRAAFQELMGFAHDHSPKSLTEAEIAAYPTILFQLYGEESLNKEINSDPNQVSGLAGDLDPEHPYDVILALPPSHYMERDSTGKYVSRFYDDERGGSVLGANSMMGHDIMFDADNFRIGWAESDCDYQNLVTSGGFLDVLDDTTSAKGESALEEGDDNVDDDGAMEDDDDDAVEGGDGMADDDDGLADLNAIEGDDSVADDDGAVEDDDGLADDDDGMADDDGAVEDDDGLADLDAVEDDDGAADNDEENDEFEIRTVPPSGNDKEEKNPDSAGFNSHDSQSPVDDLKKKATSLADSCDTLSCRGGAAFAILLVIIFVLWCGRKCRSGQNASLKKSYERAAAELELSDTDYRGGHAFDDDDTHEAEYGEFFTDRRIT